MARPLEFHAAPRDPRERLRADLESAPDRHAEALLAAYDILQGLHDRGILDVLTGVLAAGDELLDATVSSLDTEATIRALRNLLFWRDLLGRIEPDWLHGIARTIPDEVALATMQRHEPPSLWKILRRALGKDSRRGLTAVVDLLESVGRRLNAPERGGSDLPPASDR